MRRGRSAGLLQDLRSREAGREVRDLHGRRLRRDVGLQLRPGRELRLLQDSGGGQHGLSGGDARRRRPTAPSTIACSATARAVCPAAATATRAARRRSATASARRRTRPASAPGAARATRRGPAPPARLLVRLTNPTHSHSEAAPAHETSAVVARNQRGSINWRSLLAALASCHDEPPIPEIATCAATSRCRKMTPGAPRCGAGDPDLPHEPFGGGQNWPPPIRRTRRAS